jgi:hypothetical protein
MKLHDVFLLRITQTIDHLVIAERRLFRSFLDSYFAFRFDCSSDSRGRGLISTHHANPENPNETALSQS